jgi:ubiquinone/menaquinone biosynthesis C-methylase UbiE
MVTKRKPFQGVWNIIRFNWHFYALSAIALLIALFCKHLLPVNWEYVMTIAVTLAVITIVVSLLVSYYVYDVTDLYKLNWLNTIISKEQSAVINITAGFDETSAIIQNKFPHCTLTVCDFYNPFKHTEVSIKRARQAYPSYPGTIVVQSNRLPFANNLFDCATVIFAAHEIRDAHERLEFFKELNRISKHDATIVVTEHIRDAKNFIAYNIGFFHFYTDNSWRSIFFKAGFVVNSKVKNNPFVTTYILCKNAPSL